MAPVLIVLAIACVAFSAGLACVFYLADKPD